MFSFIKKVLVLLGFTPHVAKCPDCAFEIKVGDLTYWQGAELSYGKQLCCGCCGCLFKAFLVTDGKIITVKKAV